MTSKIEESDSYAMLCLSLSVFYFGWFMAPPCKSRKTDALSRMNLVHFGAPVLTAIQSSTIRAKHISSPQNATFEIRLVWFFTSLSKWCVFFYFRLHWLLLFQHVCRWTQRPGFEGTMAQCPPADSCLCCFEKSPLENRHNIYQFKIS